MSVLEEPIREEVMAHELESKRYLQLRVLLGIIDELRNQIRDWQVSPKQKSPVLMTYDVDDGAVHLGDEHFIIEIGHDDCDALRSYLENLGIMVEYTEKS